MPKFMTESSILFQTTHLDKQNITLEVLPQVPLCMDECQGGQPSIYYFTAWNVLLTYEHIEYDRMTTFHVDIFTICNTKSIFF